MRCICRLADPARHFWQMEGGPSLIITIGNFTWDYVKFFLNDYCLLKTKGIYFFLQMLRKLLRVHIISAIDNEIMILTWADNLELVQL